MKRTLCICIVLLFFAVASSAQTQEQEVAQTGSFTSMLEKGNNKRFAALPILGAFPPHLTSEAGNFGFRVDSALMTRDLETLLSQVEFLARLEDSSQMKSAYLTASALMDTTAGVFLKAGNNPYRWNYYRQALSLAQQTGATHGLAILKTIASKYDEYLNEREETARLMKVREEEQKTMRTEQRAYSAPRAKNAPAAARSASAHNSGNASGGRTAVPVLNIVNSSGKVLYVYLDDEYKGILYVGKSLPLKGLTGCWELSVESLDQFKSTKKHCFGPAKTQEWVIKTN